jgi:redox-regulated HSP33 family molecular chaperone
MPSQLQKAIGPDGLTQILMIDAKDVVQESLTRLKAWPPAMIHLGQGLMGAALLHALLSKEENSRLSLQWSVRGPFGDLYVESNALGKLRGTIMEPQAPVHNMHARLGSGVLQVRRTEKETMTGVVSAGGDICMDLLTYLKQSEQRPCAMNLWVDLNWDASRKDHPVYVRHALGYLIEVLPDEHGIISDARIMEWENFLASLGKLSHWQLDEAHPLPSMLRFLFPGRPAKTLMYQALEFKCTCTEERAESALALALNQESSSPRKSSEQLTCEFCGKVYDL